MVAGNSIPTNFEYKSILSDFRYPYRVIFQEIMIPRQMERLIGAQSTGKQEADRCDLRCMLLCPNGTAEEDKESPRVSLATAIFALTYVLVSLEENSSRKLTVRAALLGAVRQSGECDCRPRRTAQSST